jgi:uncharacterized protein (TIGR02466 family)
MQFLGQVNGVLPHGLNRDCGRSGGTNQAIRPGARGRRPLVSRPASVIFFLCRIGNPTYGAKAMSRFIHLFPLSVYRDKIVLDEAYKRQLVELILAMEAAADRSDKPAHSAWLGDTQGFEFLFQRPEFMRLFRQISQKVRDYSAALGINNRLIDFCYQRSWATVTRRGERINQHAHEQSNISFAYYLQKPRGSGGISFITDNHPNEFSRGIFSPSKESLGFIDTPSMLTWNHVNLDPEEDDIVIFPSKTLHATLPNDVEEPRISISADITALLRDSRGHETMMPHFSQWRSFDDFLEQSAVGQAPADPEHE